MLTERINSPIVGNPRVLKSDPLAAFSPPAVEHSSRCWPARESSFCCAGHPAAFAAPTLTAARPSTPPCRNPGSHHRPQIRCASSPQLPPTPPPAPSSPSTHSRSEAAPPPIALGSHTPQNPASPQVSPPPLRPPPLCPSPPSPGNSPNARSQ